MTPSIVMRPMVFADASMNHSAPSPPAMMFVGARPGGKPGPAS
jgi:hypothetical protein